MPRPTHPLLTRRAPFGWAAQHDYAGEGLHPFQGRGATELDVLEGAVTNIGAESYVVGSLQLSPGIPP